MNVTRHGIFIDDVRMKQKKINTNTFYSLSEPRRYAEYIEMVSVANERFTAVVPMDEKIIKEMKKQGYEFLDHFKLYGKDETSHGHFR